MAAPPRLLADTVLQVCRLAQKLKSRWQRRRLLLALLLVPSAGLLLAALRRLLVHRHTVLHFAANRRAMCVIRYNMYFSKGAWADVPCLRAVARYSAWQSCATTKRRSGFLRATYRLWRVCFCARVPLGSDFV